MKTLEVIDKLPVQFGFWKCLFRTVYLWFRFPIGEPVSGHDFVEMDNGDLRCKDCGTISRD